MLQGSLEPAELAESNGFGMIALHLREMAFEKIIDGSIIFSKISPNVQSRYAGLNPVIRECKAIIS